MEHHEKTKPKNNRVRRKRRTPAQRHREYIYIFNKIKEDFLTLKKDMPMKVQEAYRALSLPSLGK